MVKTKFHAVCQYGELTNLINTEYGALVAVVEGELDKCMNELEWGMILSSGISK